MGKVSTCKRTITLAVITSFCAPVSIAQTENTERFVPILRAAPKYPSREITRKREAWVDLSLVVEPDGTVVDPIVLRSNGRDSFRKAASNAALRFRYQPGALTSGSTIARITFRLDNMSRGISPEFSHDYNLISDLIKKGDYKNARTRHRQLDRMKGMNQTEVCRYWYQHSRIAELEGNSHEQLLGLRRAIVNGEAETKLVALKELIQLELANGEFAAARTHFNTLKKTTDDKETIEPFQQAVNELQGLLDSDQPLSMKVVLGENDLAPSADGMWTAKLLRQKFRFENVSGGVKSMDLRCRSRRVVDSVAEGDSWNLHNSWGPCRLFVFGKPGASFNLVELKH